MPKANFLNSLLQRVVLNKGFDTVLKNITFLKGDNGSCVATITLTKEHLNAVGILHGGFAASLIDTVSGAGLVSHGEWENSSVSVNMDLSYLKAAKSGDEIKIISNLLHAGKKLAFMDVELRHAVTDALLVKAAHSKMKTETAKKLF